MLHRFAYVFCTLATAALFSMLSMSCACQRKFLFLKPDNGTQRVHLKKDRLEMRIEISTNSLADHRLTVINRSNAAVTIQPEDLRIEITGTQLSAAAVAKYESFLSARSDRLLSLCDKSSFSYACETEICDYYRSLRNEGFPYGTIAPGDSAAGFVAFNMPLVVSGSAWKKITIVGLETDAITYVARLTITFTSGKKKKTIHAPLLVTVFNGPGNVPYSVARLLR